MSVQQRFVPMLMAGLLTACSPVGVLNALAPRRGISVRRGLAYAPGARHRLDVYAPEITGAARPVVVFFYGGGWEDGHREMYRFVGAALAKRGLVTVIPDYRLFPQVRFPAFMHDAAASVAWTETHIAGFGGDPRRIFLMGHSAGAQIATLLALDTRYLCTAGADDDTIAGVIGLAGPYDFLPLRTPTLRAIFGPESFWPQSQPINFASAESPPMFLAAGTADTTVNPGNTRRLAARLRADGVTVETRLYSGEGHKMLIGGFAGILSSALPVRHDVLQFIAAHQKPVPAAPLRVCATVP